jgi:hypothetical protein
MINENISQPDPDWDYYDYWTVLHEIKFSIDSALKIMASTEITNPDVDKQLTQLLNPASDKLIEILTQLEFGDGHFIA